STGTDIPADARKWLKKWKQDEWLMASGIEPKGVVLQRKRVTVEEIIDAYVTAGCPTRKMQGKSLITVKNEISFLKPVRAYFGEKAAATLTLNDCDKYLAWRSSGGYVAKFNVRGKAQTMQTHGGNRAVDLELTVLCNALNLAVRRNALKANPLTGRSRYTEASKIRHCREVAPTPQGLHRIDSWLRENGEPVVADLVCFLAYSGLRIGEALPLKWAGVNWDEQVIQVKREKRGIMPWLPLVPALEALLRNMEKRASGDLLFPAPFKANSSVDASAVRRRIKAACAKLKIGHVTPHGLRSYFVTQARQSGLTDAEIAMLIGDKTGPAIIAETYGDVRPEHLMAQARKISLTVTGTNEHGANGDSIKSSIALPDVAPGRTASAQRDEVVNVPANLGE
ncbi:MAG TPA: tyrosine-type recombinase/integrase, partial [Methylomirabilota bacterium]|nr:tyrosine-type recombinase/integrase [Methylomirabilota bacterium]